MTNSLISFQGRFPGSIEPCVILWFTDGGKQSSPAGVFDRVRHFRVEDVVDAICMLHGDEEILTNTLVMLPIVKHSRNHISWSRLLS